MSLNPCLNDWHGRRVWIVGASSGIGHELARQLLARGARVAASARKPGPLQALRTTHPDAALALPMDARSGGDWAATHAAIVSAWGGIDLWIFCAADYQPVRAWQLDVARAERMIDTNLTGAMRGVATVLPGMLAAGSGGIVLVGSVAGYTGLPRSLVYGPTKAALINFAESLYLDVHERGLAVSIVNPGFVDTPLTQGNDFEMPALITAAEAAGEIIAGLESGVFEIHFPRRFTYWLKFLRRLPYPIRFRLLSEVARRS